MPIRKLILKNNEEDAMSGAAARTGTLKRKELKITIEGRK